MKSNSLLLLTACGIIGISACSMAADAQHVRSPNKPHHVRARPAHKGQGHAERKARLVQKINRYWRLWNEARIHGIDISHVPVMPYIVGRDGNIYQILPSGRRQLVPDDQFHAPENLQGKT